jgi:NADH:ubiquinone oxidoreductase subunit
LSWVTLIFDWWDRATWGTWLFTWKSGEQVGSDAAGNRYYQEKGRPDRQGPHWNRRRRWVIYSGLAEASNVPPEWNAWLQHLADEPPVRPPADYAWEKPHVPNLTGTDGAYRPPGSIAEGGVRAPATGDYQAWRPK